MNAPLRIENLLKRDHSAQLINSFEPESRVLWSLMNPRGRACFNRELLIDMANFEDALRLNRGKYLVAGKFETVDFVVFASNVPGIFNLGGDLDSFRNKIRSGDEDSLRGYARQCIEIIWNRWNHFDSNITTIALIQGQALGGGFEAALPADVIVAEQGSVIGLPEVLFNLFPGMGALSLLTRKIGLRHAEEIVLSGKTYSAEYLHDIGVIDVICEKGAGREAVHTWIDGNSRRKKAHLAVQRAKQCVQPIKLDELTGIVDIWVDSAMNLDDRDLRMMGRLIHAQNRIGLPCRLVT